MALDLEHSYDALIFDMDGTLWDAVSTYTKSWNDYFLANNIDKIFTNENLMQYMGWEQDPYLEAVLPDFSKEKRNSIYNEVITLQYSNIQTSGGKLYEGVVKGLASLSKKYQLFIVSNCAEYAITHFMKWAKIETYITDSVAFGENYKSKNQNIKYLIDKYQLRKPVYIGDTQADFEQSNLVPLPFVFVSYGFGEAKEYHEKFDSFAELTDYFLH